MLLNRILCQPALRGAGALLVAVLLSTAVSAQSLSPAALRDINRQLTKKIADTTRVRLLLRLSAHAAGYIERTTARDSALQFARTALALSTRLSYDSGIYKSYLQEISVWGKVDKRIYLLGEVDTVARENTHTLRDRFLAFVRKGASPGQLAEAYAAVAFLYNDGGMYTQALVYYDSAATFFRKSGNVPRECEMLYETGLVHNNLGKLKESLPFLHRSIALAEPTGGLLLYRTYGILGRTYGHLGSNTLALKYLLKAMQLAETARDTTHEMGAIHLFLGLTYTQLKDYTLAREHFENAFRLDRYYIAEHGGEFFAAAVNLAQAKSRVNPRETLDFLARFSNEYKAFLTPYRLETIHCEMVGAYSKLHDYARAQLYCDKLIATPDAAPGFVTRCVVISRFLILSNKYDAAEKYLAGAEQVAKTEGRMRVLQNIYSLWHKVDSAKGNYAAALEKFKLVKAYGDSMLTESKEKEIAILEIEYETAKKEQSIALLTKDSELNRQQLEQSRFQKNGTLAAFGVAIIILGLLFNQYRIKKKSNIELTQRQQEIQSTNETLHKTILEKEWLLKEVNHRVKNNLQTVVSLLGSQLYSLQGSEAAEAIHDSQNRVHAMSLIHQKLYLSDQRASINMASYLSELTEHLRDSFSTGRLIKFQLTVQSIELDVSQAIPVGLIINEAVTNTIKYAFPAGTTENCQVVISMQQDSDRNVQLSIADNGLGLPPDFDGSGSQFGMGLKLIHGLMTELDGRCKIGTNNGTGVLIEIGFNANALLE